MLKVRLATVMCFAAGIISAVEVVTPERELPLLHTTALIGSYEEF